MFRTIWQIIGGMYAQRRSGIDRADIQHLRADLRFRLALVEYAYFGRSGRRVARCTAELKALLGAKAMHRYLRSLDPDLRTQFVERFQGARRDAETGSASAPQPTVRRPDSASAEPAGVFPQASSPAVTLMRLKAATELGSNVVPIDYAAARKATSETVEIGQTVKVQPPTKQGAGSLDSGD